MPRLIHGMGIQEASLHPSICLPRKCIFPPHAYLVQLLTLYEFHVRR